MTNTKGVSCLLPKHHKYQSSTTLIDNTLPRLPTWDSVVIAIRQKWEAHQVGNYMEPNRIRKSAADVRPFPPRRWHLALIPHWDEGSSSGCLYSLIASSQLCAWQRSVDRLAVSQRQRNVNSRLRSCGTKAVACALARATSACQVKRGLRRRLAQSGNLSAANPSNGGIAHVAS